MENTKSERRKTTSIQLSDDERKQIDEYATLSGLESIGKVVRHFTISAVSQELPALRERNRRRMEALGAM